MRSMVCCWHCIIMRIQDMTSWSGMGAEGSSVPGPICSAGLSVRVRLDEPTALSSASMLARFGLEGPDSVTGQEVDRVDQGRILSKGEGCRVAEGCSCRIIQDGGDAS